MSPRRGLSAFFSALLLLSAVSVRAEDGPCRRWLTAAGRPTVQGTLKDAAGQPLVSARVYLHAAPGSNPSGWVETDVSGRFEARLEAGPECDKPLQYPTTLYMSVEPPPGQYFDAPLRDIPVFAPTASSAAGAGVKPPRVIHGGLTMCGRVEFLGHPFPAGYLSIFSDERAWDGVGARPGPTERSFVRVRDGRFCVEKMAPGNYRAVLSPQIPTAPGHNGELPPPFEHRYAGLPLDPNDYRLSVEDSGAWTIYGRAGLPLRAEQSLSLSIVPQASSVTGAPRLEGRIHFPSGTLPGSKAPVYIFAHTGMDKPDERDQATWALPSTGDASEGVKFQLALTPGRLLHFGVRAGELTRVAVRYPFPLAPAAALKSRLEITLGPSGAIKGSVTLPNGRPFAPDARESKSKRSLFAVRLAGFMDGEQTDGDFADAEGGYEITHVAPGFYRLLPVLGSEGFERSVGPPRAVWIEPGKTIRLDWPLGPWAQVRIGSVEPVLLPLPASPSRESADEIPFVMSLPQERWIVALATGSLTGEGLSSLVFSDQAAFSFLQDSEGGWVPRFPWDRNRLTADHRTRPGRYDLYLVETTQRYRQPAVRVLAINKGVRINPGDTRVDFTAKTRRPEGEAQLRGRLRLSHRMGRAELEAFKRASSVAGIHAVLAPSVRLYDAAGRFAGAAFLPVSYEELSEIIDGAARNDPNSLEDFSRQRSHEFALTGLAPGTYRLVITAAGYPVVHRKVVLMKDGESLDVDLDAREKP